MQPTHENRVTLIPGYTPRVLHVRGRAEVSISSMPQLAMIRVTGVLCEEGRR